jgi:hypothetical protein
MIRLLAAILVAPLLVGAPVVARAEGLARDSADWICRHGPPDAPWTLDACSRLRGEPVTPARIIAERRGGLARDSADLVCHQGAPGDPRTLDACARLRGDPAVQRRRSAPDSPPTGARSQAKSWASSARVWAPSAAMCE